MEAACNWDGVGQGTLNVAWGRVVALDQVGMVAVHHPHEVGQCRRRAWMQPRAERMGGRGDTCPTPYACTESCAPRGSRPCCKCGKANPRFST